MHYNARQALIAIGSDQSTGKGLGQGIQSHLRFLPERQTDFIFASLAEEYGFIGTMMVLSLYGILISFCLYVGYKSSTQSEQLFCYSIAALLFFQSWVNMGMNLGLIPIAGLTLPLLSAGGSSVIALCGTLGIIQAIAKTPRSKLTLHLK